MASITNRGGRFLARVRIQGFPLVAKTFTRRSDAVAWARRIETDMESGRWQAEGKAEPATFAAALAEYRATQATKFKGASTYAYWYEELASQSFAMLPLREVTQVHLAKWRDKQDAAGLKPGTVSRKLGLLGGFMSWCVKERGLLAVNPMLNVRKPAVADGRERVATALEQAYLQRAASTGRAKWIGDALTVLLRTAMRRGELFALERENLDFPNGTARLEQTKNGSARTVPLCPVAQAALLRLASAADLAGRQRLVPITDPHTVTTAFRRTMVRAHALYRQDQERAGLSVAPGFLKGLRLHDLRHTAVSSWASTGELSAPELMAISGHKTPRMLVRYTHLSATALAQKLRGITLT